MKKLITKVVDYINETRELNNAFYESIDSIKFADYVLEKWGGSIGGKYEENPIFEKEITRLRNQCKNERGDNFSHRIYLLEASADRVTSVTPEALYIKSTSYLYAGATCRKKAIISSNLYLEGYPSNDSPFKDQRKGHHSYDVWQMLSKAYIGEKDYDNAILSSEKAVSIYNKYHFDKSNPWYGLNFFVAEAYARSGQWQKAIDILEQFKKRAKGNAHSFNHFEADSRITAYNNKKITPKRRKSN